jgi:integral membrane protein
VGLALHVSAEKSPIGAPLALGGTLGAVGLMVVRDHLVVGAVLGVVGLCLGLLIPRGEPVAPNALHTWFRWIGRAEGVSLLVLFGVAMPAKYALGYPHATLWVGWLHGVLFLLYVGGVFVGVRRLGWSVLDGGLGLLASLLPFGTFIFERRIADRG